MNAAVSLTGTVGTETSQQLKTNVSLHTHGAGVDLEDVCTALKRINKACEKRRPNYKRTLTQTMTRGAHLQVGKAKLDLPVQTSRSHQGRVQCVRSVGGHQDFDVASGVEAVQLVDELQHGPLDLVVSAGAVIETSAW